MANKRWLFSFLLMGSLVSFLAQGYDGTVNITGTIQDNTCELAPDSITKEVDMGTFARKQFSHAGDTASLKMFTINLQNCGPAASEATLTFSGVADATNPNLFAINGEPDAARGLALAIFDSEGNALMPDKPGGGHPIKPGEGSVVLTFKAQYQSVSETINAGIANATVTFVLDYA